MEFLTTKNPLPRQYADAEVLVDFAKEIYGQPNMSPPEGLPVYIEKKNDYIIKSRGREFLPGIFIASHINIELLKTNESLNLTRYAWNLISDGQTTASIFDNTDYLIQLAITYLIKLVRETKDEKLVNQFLEILEPKIKWKATQFSKRYGLDFGEVFVIAFGYTHLMLCGENPEVLSETLKTAYSKTASKQEARTINRKERIHPLNTQKRYKGKLTDISNLHESIMPSLMEMFVTENDPLLKELLASSVLAKYPEFLALTLIKNSERIYRPNNKHNFISFVFGGRSSLWWFLKDMFKVEIKNRKKIVAFDDSLTFDDSSRVGGYIRRRWKRFSKYQAIPDKLKLEKLSQLKSILTPKLYTAVKEYYSGYFESSSWAKRRALARARKQALANGLDIEIS